MTQYNDTLESGAIIADPIMAVGADTQVTVFRRRVRSWYGEGGVWVHQRVGGVLVFAAVMTPIGWASSP